MSSTELGQQQAQQRLEGVVERQRRRLRRRFAVHGLGWLVAALAIGVGAYYALDRALVLPLPVRLLLSLGLVAFLVLGLRRRLLYPLRKAIGGDDLAVVIERRFPELRERLISALQLGRAAQAGQALRDQSAAMIERVVVDAAAAVEQVSCDEILDPRRTLRVWGIAGAAILATGTAALGNPEAFSVYLARIAGADAAYPRRTTLHVELPESDLDLRVERTPGAATVTLSAGADLPVLVRAEGVVPREVFLAISGGRGLPPRASMTARPDDRFRYVFRRISSDFSFHATGGDDDRGDLRVDIVTVRPPRVASVVAALTYPEYTGLPPRTVAGGGVEALAGTEVDLQVSTTAPVLRGHLLFLDTGAEVPLRSETVVDDGGQRTVWIASFTVERSERYQIELTSEEQLRTPHPGTYPVVALVDQRPAGRVLLPDDGGIGVMLPDGLLPVRIAARDDFGLRSVRGVARIAKADQAFQTTLLAGDPPAAGEVVVTAILDLAALGSPGAALSVGETIEFGAVLEDNREPEAHATELPKRLTYVVDTADLARRVAGHFRRIREAIDALSSRQQKLTGQLDDVRAALADGAAVRAVRGDLTVIHVGQTALMGRIARQHHQLMRAFDLHLFNRLEDSPHAAEALRMYEDYHRREPQAVAHAAGYYRGLAEARREGRLGAMPKVLDPILAMTVVCDAAHADVSPQLLRALDEAAVAASAGAAGAAVTEALAHQQRISALLEQLREQLGQWNEFQDVIIQTRSVLDKQRELEVRTRERLDEKASAERGR